MHLDLIKIKRQIEILGLVLNSNSKFDTFDLAEIFNCDEITIKRDLSELRKNGVDIHSRKNKGVVVESNVSLHKIKDFILQYLGFCVTNSTLDKATNLIVKKLNHTALSNIVSIQRCIEKKCKIIIDYDKTELIKEKNLLVSPLLIFKADNYWRLLCIHENSYRQFILNKINSIKPTSEKFHPTSQDEIAELFKNSFRSWIGKEQYHVRIRFSRTWAERLKPNLLMESQKIKENSDGSMIIETTVNSLNEIAAWIVSRGYGVKVIEPPELKKLVIQLAKAALKNY